jgi:hypothetical protein
MDKLVPNLVVLRLPPGHGQQLRAAAAEASASGSSVLCLRNVCPASLAALGESAASGAFGPKELALLQEYLDVAAESAPPAYPSVKQMVAAASLEGLSEAELAARTLQELQARARRAAVRAGLQAAAEAAEYSRMTGVKPQGEGVGEGLRAFAPQAAAGSGLLLALLSATLLGYFLGRNLFGVGSDGAWIMALVCGGGTLLLEGALLLLRLSRAEALEAQRRRAKSRLAAEAVEAALAAEAAAAGTAAAVATPAVEQHEEVAEEKQQEAGVKDAGSTVRKRAIGGSSSG